MLVWEGSLPLTQNWGTVLRVIEESYVASAKRTTLEIVSSDVWGALSLGGIFSSSHLSR